MHPWVDILKKRVLVFDGAMGTQVHKLPLDVQRDYLGRENCPEVLNLSCPRAIQTIHENYLRAGADVVETNTFGGSKLVLVEFDLMDRCREINRTAAEIARRACEAVEAEQPGRKCFVAGSLGPGTKLVTLGNTTWDIMLDSYTEQVRGLLDGGVDALLIETAQDILQVKCAINACVDALAERGLKPLLPDGRGDVPIMAQVTIETTGTMLLGTEINAAAVVLEPFPIFSLGLNCATGPTEMTERVHWLGRHWPRHISVQPNAGLPVLVEGRTEYPLGPEPFAQALARFIDDHGISIVGGCCGTTPEHLSALVKLIAGKPAPRLEKVAWRPGCSSLYEPVDYRQDNSTLNVGERTNASGSRAFKKTLESEDWDAMVSLAREQGREGSHLIDVNVDYAGRDNPKDMREIVTRFVRQVNLPMMLDSTQPGTLEAGLKCAGGKCILNSANLEDGEEKFARMIGLAKRYGAAVVLGCIDEDPLEAMARTAQRKIDIARRMHTLATQTYGLDERDIFYDPLVLPISTGMDKDRRSALETIEGTRLIAQTFPNCQITCGLSNVSFGLKPAARVVLNSVFLHELMNAGLTSAILHVSKILPKTKIDDAQWQAALDLIYDRREQGDPLQKFIDLFPDEAGDGKGKADAAPALESLPIEDKLRRHIVDGEKRHLIENLDAARTQYSPLAIINDHLLAGMKTVGELFGSGQMQLPFVLQSAEVMKMAVAHLQQFMEKIDGQSKGIIVLATVKGDVHDIGKNLVDIILSNNGYTVHNLGIKQPISNIIDSWRKTGAQAIGLSGLLVKSVQVMKENLEELNSLNITVPVVLGGAALSRHYCENDLRSTYQGKVYYGRDAFDGLRIMDHLVSGQTDLLDDEIQARLVKRAEAEEKIAAAKATEKAAVAGTAAISGTTTAQVTGGKACVTGSTPAGSADTITVDVPVAPFWGDRVVEGIKLDDITPFVNKVALYRGQWQFKKGPRSDDEYQKQLDDEVEPIFKRLVEQCKNEKLLSPKVVYGYYPAAAEGDTVVVFDPADPKREIERFDFPRQASRQRLCLSDYFRSVSDAQRDVLGLMCVTVGSDISRKTKALFESNQYQEYLYLHGLGVECAEALAEYWHKRMRQELGIAGDDSPRIRELFTQNYRGSRYSFGYPACPDMSHQEKLFKLIKPQRIDCVLTENWQIDPEQSTSAIIVHHPAAKNFAV